MVGNRSFRSVKELKGANRRERDKKISWFSDLLILKDDAFKRHACSKVVVKEVYFVPFLSSGYTKGVHFSVKNGM